MSERIQELIRAARAMPRCTAQVELLEEAVREADACGLEGAAFRVREQLMQAAELSGNGDRVLVAFSWCLAKADEKPELYDEASLLWEYKWAIFNALQFSQIDRPQIEQMLSDYARRLERNGCSPRPATYLRMQYDYHTGRLDQAELHRKQWLEQPRDRFADCPACEADNQVELLFYLGRDKQASRTAKPLVADGGLSCAEVPQRTFATLVLCGLRSRWKRRTKDFHLRGYRMAHGKLDFLRQVGLHALYVAGQRDAAKSVALLEQHLPLALTAQIPRDKLDFFTGAAAVARSLEDRELAIRLPAAHPLHRDGPLPAPELAAWLQQQADELCQLFDRRNDSGWQSELCQLYRELAGEP